MFSHFIMQTQCHADNLKLDPEQDYAHKKTLPLITEGLGIFLISGLGGNFSFHFGDHFFSDIIWCRGIVREFHG